MDENEEFLGTGEVPVKKAPSWRRPFIMVAAALILFGGVVHLVVKWQGRPVDSKLEMASPPFSPQFSGELVTKSVDYRYGNVQYYQYGEEDALSHVFVMHGAEKNMTKDHWQPHLGLFNSMGAFYLIDLPSWGDSNIYEWADSVPNAVGSLGLYYVMKEAGVVEDESKTIVLICKGWSCEVVNQFFKNKPAFMKRKVEVIMISASPNVGKLNDSMRKNLPRLPGMIIYSEKDPIFSNKYINIVRNIYRGADFFLLKRVATHSPEVDMPNYFGNMIATWWKERH